ncbi:MAG: hydroxyacylglutathione hydrolase [Xanthomonadales bacterium]|nr:hydroxyacylglutathione hydrolase [Xanthomonadales bacterium]
MTTLTALPALTDNYIWSLTGPAGAAVIVDPGEAAPVLSAVAQGLRPCAILITHHHHDHIGAAASLAQHLDIPIHAPVDDRIAMDCQRVGDGDVVRLDAAGLGFTVMAVPGHTLSHVAYAGHDVAFVGDTLFSLGCGRLFEGSPAQMWASLQRLAQLPPDTAVCCAHEYTLANAAFALRVEPDNPALLARIEHAQAQRASGRPTLPTSIALELATNPFLRCSQATIRAQVTAWNAETGTDPDELALFTALRRWKDGFIAP